MSLTSSTVAEFGRLTVLLIAPETNGCTAAIIRTWPSGPIVRPPAHAEGAVEHRQVGRRSSPGAPSMEPVPSTWARISDALALVVAERRAARARRRC